MAEVLLFHHVLGRRSGMQALAERFRSAGHLCTESTSPDDDEVATNLLVERAAEYLGGL
jgi:acetate kinase